MEEIKVGEYVRTKRGVICKVLDNWDDMYLNVDKPVFATEDSETANYYVHREYIAKHSPNIIDLIEEGDYVNGKRVDFDKFEHKLYVGNDYDNQTFIKDMDIKTILTKEQYQANCCEV